MLRVVTSKYVYQVIIIAVGVQSYWTTNYALDSLVSMVLTYSKLAFLLQTAIFNCSSSVNRDLASYYIQFYVAIYAASYNYRLCALLVAIFFSFHLLRISL